MDQQQNRPIEVFVPTNVIQSNRIFGIRKRNFTEHYRENISIDEYAASHGMSISWFIRNFKSVTGITPLQYLLNQRINNAQILLETTNYPINEVSNIVGYDNQLYFSRLFTKQKGMSPKKYRELFQP